MGSDARLVFGGELSRVNFYTGEITGEGVVRDELSGEMFGRNFRERDIWGDFHEGKCTEECPGELS